MASKDGLAAYYSTARYVPDEFRAEGVNVGVVLVCPELRIVDWKFSHNYQRVRRALSPEQLDTRRLKFMVAGLQERLSEEHSKLIHPRDFDKFVKLFRNKLQLTDPRSCLIKEPSKDVESLFERLVDQVPKRQLAKGQSAQQLRAEFRRLLQLKGLYDRLEHGVRIPARYKPGFYQFGHRYLNGKYHIVHEEGFAMADPDQNCDRAAALAIDIEDARNHESADFTVIASFAPGQPDVDTAVANLFRDKGIELRTAQQMESVVEKISQDLQLH